MRSDLRHGFLPALPVVLAVLALSGCKFAPAYQVPSFEMAPAYKENALWQQASPAEPSAVPEAWWTMFGDAELNRLQDLAAAGNQTLAGTLAQLRIAQAALDASRAPLLPTLGVNAGGTRSKTGSASSGTVDANGNVVGNTSARPRNVFTLQASASWELDLWGRISSGVDVANARVQASADDLAAARLSMQASLAQTYFAVRAAEAQLAVLDDTIAAYERSLQLTRNRYTSGVASAADVAQAESQLYSTRAQRLESALSRAQLEHALAALLGRAPADFTLAPTASLPEAPVVPVALPAALLQRRPDIAAAERRVAAANAQIGVARAGFFPALTLSSAVGYRSSTLSDIASAPNLFWSIGPALALSLPVFDGGALRAAVNSADANVQAAAATYRQTVVTALQEVEDNLVAAAALQEELGVQQQALVAAQKALDVTNNQYRAGIVSYLNVVTAQSTVLSARRSLLDVRNRRLVAVNILLKNIGGTWGAVRG
ncbi:efflux transporter outer membrane subunit [Xylophilus rhododendri]|uniref:Efflux transporter outer membrane subunit n=1 Tax=Xylophilus rhododendri TaxID=2697032 RepID=A0A857J6T7_9BURK|nr:efflux transporter outer membrane subunit [Xylophilus rhododendri]QHI99546.1 efflux transporter outer membrane subunit [Xylophilus rhododendri]